MTESVGQQRRRGHPQEPVAWVLRTREDPPRYLDGWFFIRDHLREAEWFTSRADAERAKRNRAPVSRSTPRRMPVVMAAAAVPSGMPVSRPDARECVRLAMGGPTLHEVLHDLGLRHALAPNRRRTATQRGYINACGSHHVWSEETGEILFTGPASVCWEWLRETGRLPAREVAA